MMKCLIFALALAIPGVFTAVTMKNIGYLGAGYDIFFGNPHSRGLGVDPGFRYSPIHHVYTKDLHTPDLRYKIPDNTLIRQISACRYSFVSEIVAGASSYKRSLQTAVSVEGSYYGASFSASTDFKRVQEGSKSYGTIYTEATASCDVYEAFLSDYVKFTMSTSFNNAISQLPGCSKDDTKYANIIRTFGTHYASKLKMGGMFGQSSEFTRSSYQTMMDLAVDVKVSASYSGMATSATGSASVSTFNAKSEEFRKQSSHQAVYSIGSHPPASGNVNDWISVAVSEPMPVKYTLRELYQLLTTTNFPGDKDITCKSTNLRTAIQAYCLKLKSEGKLADCSDPAADGSLPVASHKIVVKKISSWREIWSDSGSGAHRDATASVPYAPQGYAIMGSVAEKGYNTPTRQIYVVKTSSPSSLIRQASTYNRIWTDSGTGSHKDGEAYRPVCPSGFSSISDFPTSPRNMHPTRMYLAYPCIANECLTQCYYAFIWNDKGSGGHQDITWWGYTGTSTEAGNYGYFRANNGYSNPSSSIMKCLKTSCVQVVQ